MWKVPESLVEKPSLLKDYVWSTEFVACLPRNGMTKKPTKVKDTLAHDRGDHTVSVHGMHAAQAVTRLVSWSAPLNFDVDLTNQYRERCR